MIVAFLVALSASLAARDSLYGTIRASGTAEPVAGVWVTVRGYTQTAISDSAGFYVLRDISGSRLEVRFERLGFKPLALGVTLAADGAARVDVDLASVPVNLSPVTVRLPNSFAEPPADGNELGRLHVTPELAGRNPLSSASDVFEGVATAAFISGRDELTPSLHVRGGAGDQNLVLLDGIPWRGPRPLGGIAGLMPNGAVASVDVYTAAPPVSYGGALSSTIDVRPRAADHFLLDGSWDGSTVEQTMGGPLPLSAASILVSGRWTNRSVFNRPEGGESDNGFRDGVGRLAVPTGAGRLELYYLDGRNRLAFPTTQDSSSGALNLFRSAGSLGGAVWTRSLAADRAVRARIWSSRVTGDATWGSQAMVSRLHDLGISADYATDRTEIGFTLTRTVTAYRVDDSLAQFALDGAPVVAALFASRRWMPAAPLTLSTGVRLNATATWGLQVEPRLWARAALGHGVAASLGYARMHQYVQSARNEESVLDAVVAMDLPVAAGSGGLPPARSDQLTAALEVKTGAGTSILVEAYARRQAGLALVAPVTRLPFVDRAIAVGRGSIRGLDATFRYESRRLDVQAEAGLLQTSRTTGVLRYRPSDDAQRLRVGVGYHPDHQTTVRILATVGRGRPSTTLQDGFQLDPYAPMDGAGSLTGSPMATPGPLNRLRLPAYARIDFGVSRDWEHRGGIGPRMTTSLTVSNLFDRRNVLAYIVAPNGNRPVFLVPRTILLRVRWALGGPP